jgi:hypothetical protein
MPGGRGVTEIDDETALFFVVDRNDANTNVTETRYCEGYNANVHFHRRTHYPELEVAG